jgi:hypothetical protein
MKINRLDAHDRYQFFINQPFDISSCCEDLIREKPFGDHAFYIFSHPRTIGFDEKFKLFMSGKYASWEEVPEKTLIWQPRLTKPQAQTNSMLFKAYPGTDLIKIIWMIPPPEMWDMYAHDKLTANSIVSESIHDFKTAKEKLEEREPDDLSEEVIKEVYKRIHLDAVAQKQKKKINNLLM